MIFSAAIRPTPPATYGTAALARSREMTTDETWERAFAEGGTLSMQEALVIAVQELHSRS